MVAPSCDRCNNLASKDDENFRLLLVAREKVKANPARNEVLQAAVRSLRRPQARGLATTFFDSIQRVERSTPSGIYVGEGLLMTTEGARLDRVARRIVQGIFFNENGRRVPDDHAANVIHLSRIGSYDTVTREVLEEFIGVTLAEKEKSFGPAFSYWYLRSPNGPLRAHLVLSFYGALEYYGQVQPIKCSDEEAEEAEVQRALLYRAKGMEPPVRSGRPEAKGNL
jgi:hypothetical protein